MHGPIMSIKEVRDKLVSRLGISRFWGFGELGHTVYGEEPIFGLIPLH